MYLRQRCFDGPVNKTIVKPRIFAAVDRKIILKPCLATVANTYTISEKAIRFRQPDYYPYQAQKIISSFMSRHLSSCNISSKSVHASLNNFANRQTDRRTKHLPPPLSEGNCKYVYCLRNVDLIEYCS